MALPIDNSNVMQSVVNIYNGYSANKENLISRRRYDAQLDGAENKVQKNGNSFNDKAVTVELSEQGASMVSKLGRAFGIDPSQVQIEEVGHAGPIQIYDGDKIAAYRKAILNGVGSNSADILNGTWINMVTTNYKNLYDNINGDYADDEGERNYMLSLLNQGYKEATYSVEDSYRSALFYTLNHADNENSNIFHSNYMKSSSISPVYTKDLDDKVAEDVSSIFLNVQDYVLKNGTISEDFSNYVGKDVKTFSMYDYKHMGDVLLGAKHLTSASSVRDGGTSYIQNEYDTVRRSLDNGINNIKSMGFSDFAKSLFIKAFNEEKKILL